MRGAAPPGAWGSGEGEVGGSAALGAVLAECLSGEMLWSVPCEARAREHGYKAGSSGCIVAVTVKMRIVNLSYLSFVITNEAKHRIFNDWF